MASRIKIQKPKRQRSQVKLLRWSLGMVASEFGLSPKTVATRVKAAGILPGDDDLFSTADVHAAICGDYEKERTRKMKEDADQAALQNARERGELIDKADFVKRLEPIIVAMKQKILGSKLNAAEQDELCKDLAELMTK